jgi:hypothetical protein
MGLHDAGAKLEKAMRNLTIAWEQSKESWADVKMQAFEERYISELQQTTRIAIETMARMGGIIDTIYRDCSDRDSI